MLQSGHEKILTLSENLRAHIRLITFLQRANQELMKATAAIESVVEQIIKNVGDSMGDDIPSLCPRCGTYNFIDGKCTSCGYEETEDDIMNGDTKPDPDNAPG